MQLRQIVRYPPFPAYKTEFVAGKFPLCALYSLPQHEHLYRPDDDSCVIFCIFTPGAIFTALPLFKRVNACFVPPGNLPLACCTYGNYTDIFLCSEPTCHAPDSKGIFRAKYNAFGKKDGKCYYIGERFPENIIHSFKKIYH